MMKKIQGKLWKNSKTKKFADTQQNDKPNRSDPTRMKKITNLHAEPQGA
jgi:hypothetical protein